MAWTLARRPDLSGKTFLVTGANSGIGLAAVQMLAAGGGRVLMACRTPSKAEQARAQVLETSPGAELELVRLDLASLESVRACAEDVETRVGQLDVLVNNAGVMALPAHKTADGFEVQLGTNHFGHFALTGRLLPLLKRADAPRIVTVASIAHFFGKMRFDDLHAEKSYSPWGHYAQSKLANVLFHHELSRRLTAAGSAVRAVCCHPGYANTNINRAGAAMKGATFTEWFMATANRYLAQSTEKGAWPTVFAATAENASHGGYYGPQGFLSLFGAVGPNRTHRRSRDPEAMRRLWDVSMELTGVAYDGLDA